MTRSYLIKELKDLQLLANLVNNGQKNSSGVLYAQSTYYVTNDIGTYEGSPIGTKVNPFMGTFVPGTSAGRVYTHKTITISPSNLIRPNLRDFTKFLHVYALCSILCKLAKFT